MHITELIDPALLKEMVEQKYIKVRKQSPGRVMYTYTNRAYDGTWNEATTKCRGLITDDQGEIIAYPLDRIHNYGTPPAADQGWTDDRWVYRAFDKLDGSLIIMDDQKRMTTKGSFDGDVVRKARAAWEAGDFDIDIEPGVTVMFEFLSPENRIVLDYGQEERFVLLAVRDADTTLLTPGEAIGEGVVHWGGEEAQTLGIGAPGVVTLGKLATSEVSNREGAEGIVAWGYSGGLVKIKQKDYLELHRVATGIDSIRLWELIAVESLRVHDPELTEKSATAFLGISGDVVAEAFARQGSLGDHLQEALPDEWHAWAAGEIRAVGLGFRAVDLAADRWVTEVQEALPLDDLYDLGSGVYAVLKPREQEVVESTGMPMGAVMGVVKARIEGEATPTKSVAHMLKAVRPKKRKAPSSIRNED